MEVRTPRLAEPQPGRVQRAVEQRNEKTRVFLRALSFGESYSTGGSSFPTLSNRILQVVEFMHLSEGSS